MEIKLTKATEGERKAYNRGFKAGVEMCFEKINTVMEIANINFETAEMDGADMERRRTIELISREEAMQNVRGLKEVMLTNAEVINALYHVPTIESRPKGKWLRKEYYFDEWVDECSVCGEAYTMIDGTATENGYNYCPNCGAYMVADMRGEHYLYKGNDVRRMVDKEIADMR